MKKRGVNLEERFIKFTIDIILYCDKLKSSFSAQHLGRQLIRSSTSVALNYGEARGVQSTKDFIHKLQLGLKELRESFINLKIQKGAKLTSNLDDLESLLSENNELISIFVASIKTAKLKGNQEEK